MGIVSRMSRPVAMDSSDLYRMIVSTYGGGPTETGISINSDSAMRRMTVHNCVKVLSQSISQLPCHLMATSGEMREKATDHYLYRMLHDQPNSWMTAAEFWGMAVAHVSLRGNFYAFKAGIPGRPIRELIPLKADSVQEVIQAPDYKLFYRVLVSSNSSSTFDGSVTNATGSEIVTIPGDQIMHIRGLVMNGYMGLNPIEYARESIGMGLASEKFIARYFGKGLHPGAVIKHPLALSAPAHANLRETLKAKYEGLGKSHEFMLLDENMTVDFPKINMVDAQFLELGKFNQSEICGMFRVPLMLVQAGDAPTTYASAEQFMLAFVTHALTPIVVNIEKAIYRDLFTEEEKGRYFAKFEMRGLLRGAFKEQMEGLKTAVNTEIMNPNEARAVLDLNPYPGGEEYRTRTSTVKEPGGDNGDPEKGAEK